MSPDFYRQMPVWIQEFDWLKPLSDVRQVPICGASVVCVTSLDGPTCQWCNTKMPTLQCYSVWTLQSGPWGDLLRPPVMIMDSVETLAQKCWKIFQDHHEGVHHHSCTQLWHKNHKEKGGQNGHHLHLGFHVSNLVQSGVFALLTQKVGKVLHHVDSDASRWRQQATCSIARRWLVWGFADR